MGEHLQPTVEAGGDHHGSPLLTVTNLSVSFRNEGEWLQVVDQLSFSLASGRTLGLAGESGSGKSVTALAMMGLLPRGYARTDDGEVAFSGTDLLQLPQRELNRIRGRDIGMVFQEPSASLDPAFTLGEQIAEVVRRHERCSRRQAWDRAVSALDAVRIPNAAQRARDYPHQFSGGMQQRAMVATALVCRPKLLIADEPTTALDVTTQAQLLDLLRDLQTDHRMAVLFITHDLGIVRQLCDDVAIIYAGQMVEYANASRIFESPKHPYTEALLSAQRAVSGDPSGAPIPGRVPLPNAFPTGCRFHPRCPHAQDPCTRPGVELREVVLGHSTRCIRSEEIFGGEVVRAGQNDLPGSRGVWK